MSPTLPLWLQYLQALALPIIAGCAAFIAFLQFELAKERRRDDLFDRRYELLETALAAAANPFPDSIARSEQRARLDRLFTRSALLFDSKFRNELVDILVDAYEGRDRDEKERYKREGEVFALFASRMK